MTFSITAKRTILRCLLTVSTARNWFTYHLDVQNAFLHGYQSLREAFSWILLTKEKPGLSAS